MGCGGSKVHKNTKLKVVKEAETQEELDAYDPYELKNNEIE